MFISESNERRKGKRAVMHTNSNYRLLPSFPRIEGNAEIKHTVKLPLRKRRTRRACNLSVGVKRLDL